MVSIIRRKNTEHDVRIEIENHDTVRFAIIEKLSVPPTEPHVFLYDNNMCPVSADRVYGDMSLRVIDDIDREINK